MLRLIKNYEFEFLERNLYIAHYNEASNHSHITKDSRKIIRRRLKSYSIFLKKNYHELKNHKTILAKFYFRIAQNLYLDKKAEESQSFFSMAFLNNPLNIRYIFRSLSLRFKNIFFILHLVEKLVFQRLIRKFVPDNGI